MTAKQRFLAAIKGGKADRLPVTTHHVMSYFLTEHMGGMSYHEFFDHFGLDPIVWIAPHRPDEAAGEYSDPLHEPGFLESRRISSDQWRIESEPVPDEEYTTTRFRFITPKGELTMLTQANQYTGWATEKPVKHKDDIDLIGEFATAPKCDVDEVNRAADEVGQRALLRSHVCCFDIFGQPGCWQDAACLYGIEALIIATFEDPKWVHEFLRILQRRKMTYIRSMAGARYDILELGGGDASSTVISRKIFDEFVAPYDGELIAAAHEVGQRISYHTCGGMMPILANVLQMKPDAMETFTPPAMGGDTDLAAAKKRVGEEICMIGGFDQFHFFKGCTPADTRREVRRCFQAAGAGGGYILCPSDHFFDAEPELIRAYADEARQCTY